MNKITKEEFDVVSEVSEQTSRRNFFKKTATYSMGALAAASVVAPVTIDASEHIKANPEDDPNIMEEKPWSLKFGAPVTECGYKKNNTNSFFR
jgi:sulfane dehydrogenase subunit SoxC